MKRGLAIVGGLLLLAAFLWWKRAWAQYDADEVAMDAAMAQRAEREEEQW